MTTPIAQAFMEGLRLWAPKLPGQGRTVVFGDAAMYTAVLWVPRSMQRDCLLGVLPLLPGLSAMQTLQNQSVLLSCYA
jgi:hypothetical protein